MKIKITISHSGKPKAENRADFYLAELRRLQSKIENFRREYRWELTFCPDLQAELRALKEEFYATAQDAAVYMAVR